MLVAKLTAAKDIGRQGQAEDREKLAVSVLAR